MKRVEILGTGCSKCDLLARNLSDAIAALNLECEVVTVTDIDEIHRHGVCLTPSLAVDGHIMVNGRVPDVDELKHLLN